MCNESKAIVFKETLDCAKCGENANIISLDIKCRRITYKCSHCDEEFSLDFEEAKGEEIMNCTFTLNELGELTYSCGSCSFECDYVIAEDSKENRLLLDGAYEGMCPRCHKKYNLFEFYSDQNEDPIEGEHYYSEEEEFRPSLKKIYEGYYEIDMKN